MMVENAVSHLKYLEEGADRYDPTKMLETSIMVRIGKGGQRYLIISFRYRELKSVLHRAMPKRIFKEAKDLRASVIMSTFNGGVQQEREVFRKNKR